jgi:uncharacterized ferritin-like protein (DUF455 family)
MTSLAVRAVEILSTAQPEEKTAKSLKLAADWRAGLIAEIGTANPPMQPARPDKPEILSGSKMPRRGAGGSGKATLMHALAHIEFNAIDLAWDIIARFTDHDLPRDFYDEWVRVAADETEHFLLLVGLLRDLGSDYGAFPAHAGLWEAAEKTAHDLQARLAVVPMTFEARALDTAPPLMNKLRQAKDEASLAVLQRIFDDEIVHVAIGARWFEVICRRVGEDPASAYQRLVSPHFPKGLRPPFNDEGRQQAGLPETFYKPLAASVPVV